MPPGREKVEKSFFFKRVIWKGITHRKREIYWIRSSWAVNLDNIHYELPIGLNRFYERGNLKQLFEIISNLAVKIRRDMVTRTVVSVGQQQAIHKVELAVSRS